MRDEARPGEAAGPVELVSTWQRADRSTRVSINVDRFDHLRPHWDAGRCPALEWDDAALGLSDDIFELSQLVKAELFARYKRGDLADAGAYLARFPLLRHDQERGLSLIFEEFCLREEFGATPAIDSFCDRYSDWRSLLAKQLECHRMISRFADLGTPPRYPHPGEYFANQFRLRSVLGEGGAARVYLAEQSELGDRPVALKLSAAQSREPSIQGRLDHAHIVPVWSVINDKTSGLLGLCMPYRPGRPLDLVIRLIDAAANRPSRASTVVGAMGEFPDSIAIADAPGWRGFPTKGSYCEAVAWIGARLARALAHAHALGICHRDVKPANILLTYREGPQLLDFNLAHEPHSAQQAQAALRGGTLPYMAPEQLRCFLDPDQWNVVGGQSDLYSLGLVLDEMLTGRRVKAQSVDPDALPRLINELIDYRLGPRVSPRVVNSSIPHGLAAIIEKCTAANPLQRYASAEDLAEDLERFVARRGLRHAINPSRSEAFRNAVRRSRVQISIAAVVLVATACVPVARGIFEPPTTMTVRAGLDASLRMDHLNEELRTARPEKRRELEQRIAQNYREALSAFETVLVKEPKNFPATLGKAHLRFAFEHDPYGSLELYDRGIALMKASHVAPKEFVAPLLSRAAVQIELGRLTQGEDKDVTSESLRESQHFFQRALNDLSEIRAIRKKGQLALSPQSELRFYFFNARTRLGLGDVETGGFERPQEALDHYAAALKECDQAQTLMRELVKDANATVNESLAQSVWSVSFDQLRSEIVFHTNVVRKELP